MLLDLTLGISSPDNFPQVIWLEGRTEKLAVCPPVGGGIRWGGLRCDSQYKVPVVQAEGLWWVGKAAGSGGGFNLAGVLRS